MTPDMHTIQEIWLRPSDRFVRNSVIGAISANVRSRRERTFPRETADQRSPMPLKRRRPVIRLKHSGDFNEPEADVQLAPVRRPAADSGSERKADVRSSHKPNERDRIGPYVLKRTVATWKGARFKETD